jgi:uncharacterized protein (TIGR03437 family)
MMRSAGLWFLTGGALWAQQYVISTIAGGAPPATPAPGLSISIGEVESVTTDAAGNAYFTSPFLNCVLKLDQSGVVTVIAGNSRRGYSGDGGPATSAQLNNPAALAVDDAGNLFIGESYRVRRVSPSGIITTVAGDGSSGFSGDGGPATRAQIGSRAGVAVDGGGNLFISDPNNNRVRKVSPNGIITTLAGNGTRGFSGDGGPATNARLYGPFSVAVDDADNLFFADSFDEGGPGPDGALVREVSLSGTITTVAGGSLRNDLGDGGPATSAQIFPESVAVDGLGNLFIADSLNQRVRKVAPAGIITTVAGNGPVAATLGFGYSGDGGPATSAQLNWPTGVAVDRAGSLFIADNYNHRIREVRPSGTITTVGGGNCLRMPILLVCQGSSGDGGPATNARLYGPFSVAVDDADNLFFADSFDEGGPGPDGALVREVSLSGTITTVAGYGTYGFSGDGGTATSALLSAPAGVAVDGAGNLFIADSSNNRIRAVSPDGTITTVAGNGSIGQSGDGGPATGAQLNWPLGVAVDGIGNLFIADTGNHRIRTASPNGAIITVAGNGTQGFSGDGGPAVSAQLNYPLSVAVDGAGNLFIADGSNRIRKVSPDGIITTVAGAGVFGYSGDGGPAASAQISGSEGVAVDGAGNVYIADTGNNAIRVLRPTSHSVLIGAVVDAASRRADPISPGKIVVIYGAGLGPAQLIQNQPKDGQFSMELGGTTVSFNGIAAPILCASATRVAAIVPYAITSKSAQVAVAYQGETSATFTVPVALAAPSLFTSNQTGAGQAAAINADSTVNTADNPVKIGGYISLYATGEGQTAPAGIDGKLGGYTPILPVRVTVGGLPATVQSAGGAQGQVSGLMQVDVQIPAGVQPGGYVDVVLQVGDASTTPDAVWIAVSAN